MFKINKNKFVRISISDTYFVLNYFLSIIIINANKLIKYLLTSCL